MTARPVNPNEEAERERVRVKSRWLAELYLQPLFPPEEEAREFAARVEQAGIDIGALQAAGLSYDVARRTYIGLPPYPQNAP